MAGYMGGVKGGRIGLVYTTQDVVLLAFHKRTEHGN